MTSKIIRDPVHGYIKIRHEFVSLIDSAEFQRLKWVEQGSFRILYPAARHDRFIHSLGVYHLAMLFSEHFLKNVRQDLSLELPNDLITQRELDTLERSFLYAALLHDIGHAPFSHTCEDFYERKQCTETDLGVRKIDHDLLDAVRAIPAITPERVDAFRRNYKSMKKPSPHEILSATILIRNAGKFLENPGHIDLELAARMIIGCTYTYTASVKDDLLGLKNCFIRLLNSTSVDVDKLDYITRDAMMSGFDNVVIDIQRLVASATAIKNGGHIYPAFKKNALSVIDNVYRAKNEEGTWMISHPVVAYEGALLRACVLKLGNDKFIEDLFSIETLGMTGKVIQGKKFHLVSDVDIIAAFKQKPNSRLHREYFARYRRRKPVWKSFNEYRQLFGSTNAEENYENRIFDLFNPLMKHLKIVNIFKVNKSVRKKIKKKEARTIAKAKANGKTAEAVLSPVLDLLYEFSENYNVPFDFVIVPVDHSFTPKIDANKIYVRFDNMPGNLTSGNSYATYHFLKGNVNPEPASKNFFYLYCKHKLKPEQIAALRDTIINNLDPPRA